MIRSNVADGSIRRNVADGLKDFNVSYKPVSN